jgi:hypothetical protein
VQLQNNLLGNPLNGLNAVRLNLISKAVDIVHQRGGCSASEEPEPFDKQGSSSRTRRSDSGAQAGASAANDYHFVFTDYWNLAGRFAVGCRFCHFDTPTSVFTPKGGASFELSGANFSV